MIEKGSEVGAHLLSGAAFEPRALNAFPDWKERGAPLHTACKEDFFMLMTERQLPLAHAPADG